MTVLGQRRGGCGGGSSYQFDNNSSKYPSQRPRRPDTDTIAYLRGLPIDALATTEETARFLEWETIRTEKGPPTSPKNRGKEDYGGNNDDDRSDVDAASSSSLDYPVGLAATLQALYEIRREIASLSGEEGASEMLEVLVRCTAPYSETAARMWLSGCTAYAHHMSLHRYGSHVLQTILECCCCCSTTRAARRCVDMALHEQAPPLPPSLLQERNAFISEEDGGRLTTTTSSSLLPTVSESVLRLSDELRPHAAELAVHVCGSHVLRTLACALAGVKFVQSGGADDLSACLRRGKIKSKKKKKRKNRDDAATEALRSGGVTDHQQPQMFYLSSPRLSVADETIHAALSKLTESIAGTGSDEIHGPGELQQLACHPSAGPLLMVLLRVLCYSTAGPEWRSRLALDDSLSEGRSNKQSSYYPDHHLGLLRAEPRFEVGSTAHVLANRLLCWQANRSWDEQEWAADCIYGLAGEPRGSHVLETILRLCPDNMHASIVATMFVTTTDNNEDDDDTRRSSVLIEYVEHNVSNFVLQTALATARSGSQAADMIDAVLPLVENGWLLDPANRRRGVLWRAIETAAENGVRQSEILKSLCTGFTHLQKEAPDAAVAAAIDKSPVRVQDLVPKLLHIQHQSQHDSRALVLDVAGTRSLYHLLRFAQSRHRESILSGIIDGLSAEDLELLAKDGLGSRCVWEGMLESTSRRPSAATAAGAATVGAVEQDASAFAGGALRRLVRKLAGRWVACSVHHVGRHCVKKLFSVLSSSGEEGDEDDACECLVRELAAGKARLNGTAAGRDVIEACGVRQFASGGSTLWRQTVRKAQQKEAWLNDIVANSKSSASSLLVDPDDRDDDNNDDDRKKKKRHQEGNNGSSNKEQRKGEKKKQSAVINLDSIMDQMTVPSS